MLNVKSLKAGFCLDLLLPVSGNLNYSHILRLIARVKKIKAFRHGTEVKEKLDNKILLLSIDKIHKNGK